MRVLPAALLLASALLLAGCSEPDPGANTTAPVTHEIAMHSQTYEPSTITVAKGDLLQFQAHDTTHAAKSTDGTYDAGDIPVGTVKDLAMSTAGTFTFKCHFHPPMQLTVTVTP